MYCGGINIKQNKNDKIKNQIKKKKPFKGFFYLISDKDNFVSDFHTFLI